MNNIYKVIWSKAKNCYVVASEIARSHTKSASGSEKIGGVARHALLALGAACAIACGGFVNVGAAVQRETISPTATTSNPVLTASNPDDDTQLNKVISAAREDKLVTKDNIAGQLTDYAKASDLSAKADANDVYSKTDAKNTFATKTELGSYATRTELDAKANTNLSNLTEEGKNAIKTTMADELAKKADAANVYTMDKVDEKLDLKANKAEVSASLNEKADKTDLEDATDRITANEGKITELQTKTQKIKHDVANDTTSVNGMKVGQQQVDMGGKNLTNVGTINGIDLGTKEGGKYISQDGSIWGNMKKVDTQVETNEKNIETNKTAITNLDTKVGTVGTGTYLDPNKPIGENLGRLNAGLEKEVGDRTAEDTNLSNRIGTVTENGNYIKKSDTKNVSENLIVLDTQAKTNADAIAKETADREAAIGELAVNGNYIKKDKNVSDNLVELDKQVEANADAITETNQRTAGIIRDDTKKETSIEGKVTVDTNGNIKAEGTITSNGLDARAGEIKTTGKVSAGDVSTGTLETTGNAKIGGDLTVNGKLNVGEIYMEHKKQESTGEEYDSATSITADGISNNAKVTDRNGVKTESKFTHDKEGSTTYAYQGDAANWKKSTSNVTADGVENVAEDSKGNNNTFTQTSTDTKNTLTDKEGNTSTTRQDSKGIYGYAKDKDGNKSYTKQEGNRIAESVIGQDGKQTKSEMTSTNITNTAKDGTITSDAKDIVNKATGNISNSSATMDTTVTGKATESYGELETEVKGNEKHTVKGDQTNEVDGKQINTIKNGQENIISGGQTNTITGGQINNITGDQTTTITGNKTETVTENVTEDYKKDLTTTVGGNEIHEVKGTKTETVEGKVTETFKGGQETYVTGDQTTNVSGTQTTTATDINRNASSGMIDTIDNDYGTNTETKVAGKTTTDVSIKGTGEKGKYIRGANESRDYLIKDTLKNSETKTAEATSSEVTDGTNKASTIQDAKNLAGSVTNGTETGISGIHANNDGSVSIDSIVVGGGMSSVINQKKDSIQSAVGDGTNSTVIRQDKDNVAIASSNGTVAIAGKDIVNNASNSITDKVGDNTRVTTSTSITDTVGTANRKIENGKIIDTADDSTVTTENGKGTTFTKTGSTAYSTAAGAPTDTNIAGNHITTGRVDANELGVSDKDGANTADFSVEAGERKGVKASADNGTTTGSLDVTAEEVSSSVKDASGKGSTFKQRIDAIMMESKNVSITAEEKLTNEAKDIVTNASHSITEKVGDTNVTEKTTTSSKSEIQNADTITSVQQTESMVQSYVGKKDGSATNVTTNFANASANQVTENGQTSTVLNNKDGLLIRNTANGSSFTTADGTNTGRASEWTNVKGNEISTGKVEANYVKMDYADVMRDLGVRGNANITGKTTTGSLEVTGTSTLKGDVTMGSNATVKKDLTVEGNTNLKNTKVDGTLDVTQKATFGDSVSIAKDLSVDGNATIKGDVTAKSYKVGDKTYISAAGINANDQKITNVADGSISEGSKDAVNGGQLYTVKNDLEGKVNKVGANAAAMANLHPMEFDPDSKWNIAAAIGNYGSETAAALGAFYRPNDDVMVNLSTAFGTGENMVGGGVSVRLGKGSNKLSRQESNALKAQVNDLTARMDALLSVLNPNMSKDFPDVPENHWAYEAVSRLAGNDIVQGYPDGEFHGDRTMTRYEMAEIIYNALSRGAEAEKELVEEFKPELQAMAASEKATAERAEG